MHASPTAPQSQATFREGALGLLAAACHDARNHAVMCRKGLARDLCEETARLSTPLAGACVAALAALAASPAARPALRAAGAAPALVPLLRRAAAAAAPLPPHCALALRTLATLAANDAPAAAELVRAGAVPVLTALLARCGTAPTGDDHGDDKEKDAKKDDKEGEEEEEDKSAREALETSCLWALATVACAREAHAALLHAGAVEQLAGVLARRADYALAALLQLTAAADCRARMLACGVHTALVRLVARAGTGTGTGAGTDTAPLPAATLRRALQALANLCVDEAARRAVAAVPRAVDTVLAAATRLAPTAAADAAADTDARALLQCLKLFSNLLQTRDECTLFCAAGGVRWLCALCEHCNLAASADAAGDTATGMGASADARWEAAVEVQVVHLAANVLVHAECHDAWVAHGGLPLLRACLAAARAPGVQREAARALSNLVAWHDDVRDAAHACGLAPALLAALRRALRAHAPAPLPLFLLRALAPLALACNRAAELRDAGILDVLADAAAAAEGSASEGGNSSEDNNTAAIYDGEEAAGVLVLVLATLSNLAGSFEVARRGDVRTALATDGRVGAAWTARVLATQRDRAVQGQALQHALLLATTAPGRAALAAARLDAALAQHVLVARPGEDPHVLRHLELLAARYADLAAVPSSDASASTDASAATAAAAVAARRGWRARRRAMILSASQVSSVAAGGGVSTGEGSSNGGGEGQSDGTDSSETRRALLAEHLASERQYVAALNVALWKFARPLVALPPLPPRAALLLPARTVAALFAPLAALADVATACVDVLETRARAGGDTRVADVFAALARTLRQHAAYSAQLPALVAALLAAEQEHAAFRAFVARQERSPHCGGRTLRALLALPLDRPAHYASLFADYARALPAGTAARAAVQAAADTAADAAAQICHHDVGSLDSILLLEQRLKGRFDTLVAPGRRLVREGRARLLRIGDKLLESPLDCTLLVFSDLLVVAKVAKHDKLKILDRIPLDDVLVSLVCRPLFVPF